MADSKITGLSANTDPQGTDILYIVDDPGGTPASEKITVANLINAVVDVVPMALVYHNTTQSITSAVITTATWNSEFIDTDTIHDTGSNPERLTCQTAGKYFAFGAVRFAANVTGIRQIWFREGGSSYFGVNSINATSTGATMISITAMIDLAVSDYIEMQVYQSSGGALNIEWSANYASLFGMFRVG